MELKLVQYQKIILAERQSLCTPIHPVKRAFYQPSSQSMSIGLFTPLPFDIISFLRVTIMTYPLVLSGCPRLPVSVVPPREPRFVSCYRC